MGEHPQLLDRCLELITGVSEQLRRASGGTTRGVGTQVEARCDCHQTLLRSVVKVALEPASLDVGRGNEPRA
jgi:hypothetical protein